MNRQIILSLTLIGVLLVVSITVAAVLIAHKPVPPRVHVDKPVLLVETIEIQPMTVVEPIVGYGTARADRSARLAAQVTGEIVELPDELKPGVEVAEGQVLLRVDPEQYERQLTRARSALAAVRAQLETLDVESSNIDELIELARNEFDIADREYQRVKGLFDRDLAPKREYDLALLAQQARQRALQELLNRKALIPTQRSELEAMLGNREAEQALAEINFKHCVVTAPFAGRVEYVLVDRGDWVSMGTLLVNLLDPGLIEVPVELPVSIRPRVSVGSKCELAVDSMPDVAWSGRVKRIAPSASETLRTFKLYVEVDNKEQPQQLLPGYFVRAAIDGPTLENVMIVPRGVVQHGRVYVCNDGKALPRDVQVERPLRDRSVVTGLKAGDLVITSNLDVLYEGLPVSPLDNSAGARAEPSVQSNGDAVVETK